MNIERVVKYLIAEGMSGRSPGLNASEFVVLDKLYTERYNNLTSEETSFVNKIIEEIDNDILKEITL